MVIRRVVAPRIDFGPLRRELGLPERFPRAAQREADEVAAAVGHQATYPAAHRPTDRRAVDRTDIPLVTVDPAESRDLDQAMCLRRRAGGGYRVLYAIADRLRADIAYRTETLERPPGSALDELVTAVLATIEPS